jgi:hypothetical protein
MAADLAGGTGHHHGLVDQRPNARIRPDRVVAKTDIATASARASQQPRRVRQRRAIGEMQEEIGRIHDKPEKGGAGAGCIGKAWLPSGLGPLLQPRYGIAEVLARCGKALCQFRRNAQALFAFV